MKSLLSMTKSDLELISMLIQMNGAYQDILGHH